MAQQSSGGGRPRLSEKGLLTPDNCVVALIDHRCLDLCWTRTVGRCHRAQIHWRIVPETARFAKRTVRGAILKLVRTL